MSVSLVSARLRCAAGALLRSRTSQVAIAALLSASLAFASVASAFAAPKCKPSLAVTGVTFSGMNLPSLERRWSAVVEVDAKNCTTTAGYFEMGFLREKENGIDLEFKEQFIWSTPSVMVSVDFWADEAVGSYWIDSVQACPCAQ